jgi:opacity protein-like surface antigen
MKFRSITLFSAALLAGSVATAATPINGWYSSIFGGYAYVPENISNGIFGFSDVAYKSGYNGGLRLGYQSAPMRYELEYTFIQANTRKFEFLGIEQFGVSGRTRANLGMANLYYDFPDVILPTISPFLGLGIGYAFVQSSLNSTGPAGGTLFTVSQSLFAYQGTAGLTFNFAENWALNASYRYVATNNSGIFGTKFQAQLGNVGIVYRFADCEYK